MLTNDQEQAVSAAVEAGLVRAERTWKQLGKKIVAKGVGLDHAMESLSRSAPSSIPGHPWVSADQPTVDEFVALVVDMRNSSEHLKSIRASAKVEYGFQRVYYETSALLPAMSTTCAFEEGVVTEYLGDGALILFRVDPENRGATVKQAYRAAENCVHESRSIVNRHLEERFNLPKLNIGVGLAMSKALVTMVGAEFDSQPKAIGECVWEATKLSGGTNTIHISEALHGAWPTSKGGKLQFESATMRTVKGFRIKSN